MKNFGILAVLFTAAVLAGRTADASTVNISVNPLVTEMRVAPGATDRTWTTVTNNGDVEERITVEAVDWTTRNDGTIALQSPGAQGRYSLDRFLEPITYGFVLLPHAHRRLDVALALPQSGGPAPSAWGGFLIRATPLDGSLAIGPAATFFVYNDSRPVNRHLTVLNLHASAVRQHGTVQINARLKNDSEAYARTGGTLTIYRNDKAVMQTDVPVGVVFPGHGRTVQFTEKGLPSGRYTIDLKFEYGGETLVDAQTSVAIP